MEEGVSGVMRWASLAPDRQALGDQEQVFTYAELSARVLALAGSLRAAGARPGVVVGVACDRSAASVIGILGVLAAGAAYVPLDVSYPSARLTGMLEDARPAMVVATPALAYLAAAVGLPVVSPLAADAATPLRAPVPAGADDPAYVLFTSGSTGRPKGAVLSRRALDAMLAWHVAHPRLGRHARVLQFATLGFDSSVRDLLATFAVGGTLLMAGVEERRDAFRLLAYLREQAIERAFLPYAALRALAQAHAEGGALPASLREVMTGGEALALTPALRGLFAALPGGVLYNEYGPTEACVFVTSRALAGDPQAWPAQPDIGDALPHVRLHVVDEALHPVADGVEGELLIGGESLADGYVGQPELTAQRFVALRLADGSLARAYRSGDRVRREVDGRLSFLGRVDTQVKIAGNRLELGEVEACLLAHPLVREAAVEAEGGVDGGWLVAHVVPQGAAAPEAALREHATAHLPAFARPARYVLHEHLPLTPNGKVDRARLEPTSTGQPMAPAAAPATVPEQLLAQWRELLSSEALQADDNVFEHGADSLRVIQFITRLRAAGLGALSATQVYECTTVRQQAAALAGAVPATARADVAPVAGRHAGLAALRERQRRVER